MQREMKEAVAAQEETAHRTEAMLEEERARTALMMRQARGEVEQEAAAASEEASQVLSRAEQLRQAATDTEAAATRRVRSHQFSRLTTAFLSNTRILQQATATLASDSIFYMIHTANVLNICEPGQGFAHVSL